MAFSTCQYQNASAVLLLPKSLILSDAKDNSIPEGNNTIPKVDVAINPNLALTLIATINIEDLQAIK